MSLSIVPFSFQLPSGYNLPAAGSGAQPTVPSGTSSAGATSTAKSSDPVDIVSISNASVSGSFTAVTGDIYRMSDLFKASVPTGQTIAGYRVALGAMPQGVVGGQLQLNGSPVTDGRTSFSADEFAHLTYTTGVDGSQQSLVVVAQTGSRLADGTVSRETDSQALQITADVTGTRSINAMNALTATNALASPITGADADIASIVQAAGIFNGFVGSARPTLQTDGNFTAVTGDTYRMSDLFRASAPTGQAIAGYRVALGGGSGQLQLNGSPVTEDRTSFSADEFAHLTYTAGMDGSQQSLVVVAQTGTRLADGTVSRETDSQALQITADVTGTRSINAMNALSTQLTGTDADIASIVQAAGIFNGFVGSARPTLQTDGNFTAVTGDIYRMSDLFKASAPTGQAIAGYRVALGGGSGGQLQLNGSPVTDGRTSFSADEFAHLTYTTGVDGSQQSLVVVAQTGTRLADGTVSRETDSQAVQITANVTGTRSINAMNALSTQPTGTDADLASIVQAAGIFNSFVGSARPTLRTDGNFTAVTGDIFRMSDLFKANAPTGQTIAGYRVALGGGSGQLQLNGSPVTDGRSSFSADEFAHLTYTAGIDGSQQSLVVVAQTGTRLADGTVSRETDSQALQIMANVTGTRSINAMNALTATNALANPLTGADADIANVVQGAGIFTGWIGSARPTLRTDGNFTAVTGDIFRMSDLFKANAPTGQTIAGYRVALGGGSGQLQLNGSPVTDGRTSFSADEFAHLTYTAGMDGSQQSLVVVAQTGTRLADGTVSRETDSQALQITANVTGTRSINAMNALTATNALASPLTGADADIASIVQAAGIFNGFVGSARPTLQTDLTPEPPISLSALADATGTYRSAGLSPANSDIDLLSFYSAAIGSSVSPGLFAGPGGTPATALLLLNSAAAGAFQTADNLSALALAIRAYNTTKSF